MKCPKCGYLGFETRERCRHCGYDFSLAVAPESRPELPLQSTTGAGAPLSDLDLAAPPIVREGETALDLDRMIGTAETVPDADSHAPFPGRTNPASGPSLPLFGFGAHLDDPRLVVTPPPVGPPLSVRRTTPEIPRVRARTRQTPRPTDDEPSLFVEPALAPEPPWRSAPPAAVPHTSAPPASRAARLLAAVLDLVILAAVDLATVYLTLAMSGLTMSSIDVLPLAPLLGFFVVLNGGYLVIFVAATGQTLGKMATGVRVTGDDGRRVDVMGAVLRAGGCGLSALTAGLGYIPAFVAHDGRALQDRVSGTRVVSAR